MKKLVDTGGVSVVHGLKQFVGDLTRNGGLPSQVDTTELQGRREHRRDRRAAWSSATRCWSSSSTRPRTQRVHQRPLVIVPPQINKFYVFDLSPEKSIVQYALDNGFQVFTVSWRNPTPPSSATGTSTPT